MDYRIGIFFSSKGIGGGELLFLNISRYLIDNGYQLFNIDFKNGFISSELVESGHRFVHIDWNPNEVLDISSHRIDILITSASSIKLLQEKIILNAKTRLLFWTIHPMNYVEHLSFSWFYKKIDIRHACSISHVIEKGRKKSIRRFIEFLMDRSALFFMDYMNYRYTKEFFEIDRVPNYLPITFNNYKSSASINKNRPNSLLRISWMSRLEITKVKPLVVLVKELSELDLNVSISIIGDGSFSAKLKSILSHYSRISIRFYGTLKGDDRDDFLLKNTDIYFGMGTSVLDVSALGIPSAFVSYVKKFTDVEQRYCWCHETIGFDVLVDHKLYDHGNSKALKEILADYTSSGQSIASNGRNYVLSNHNLDAVGSILTNAFSGPLITYSEFSQLAPPVDKIKRLLHKFRYM